MVEELKVILKNVKEHDFTIFQSNGLALKQGEEFAHSFNVKQIECIYTWSFENRVSKSINSFYYLAI